MIRQRREFGAIVIAAWCAAAACSPFVFPPPTPPVAAPKAHWISRSAVVADLDTLLRIDEDVHPDLYHVLSRDSARALRHELIASVPDSLSRVATWRLLATFTAMFGDGHTVVAPPSDELRTANAGATLLPLAFSPDPTGRPVVQDNRRHHEIPIGARLVSVNGIAVDSLMRRLASRVSGEREAWRQYLVIADLPPRLWYDGILPPYTVEWQDGEHSTTHVARFDLPERDVTRSVTPHAPTALSVGLRNTSGPHEIGYLEFYSMTASPDAFEAALDSTFSRFARDSIRGLVIDLRRNSGGNSLLGDQVLAHFNRLPYRFSARKEWKMSAEYRQYLRRGLSPWIRPLHPERYVPSFHRFFRGPDGSVVTIAESTVMHPPRAPLFSGPVCVLIGTGTFSSAMLVANAIADFHLATLVGDETGGVPTAFGELYSFQLPNSGLRAGVSSARYVRASGDSSISGGVKPDIRVVATPAYVAAGRDVALERARSCADADGSRQPGQVEEHRGDIATVTSARRREHQNAWRSVTSRRLASPSSSSPSSRSSRSRSAPWD